MFVPEQYQGFDQNYLADIALIATVKSFKLTAWVQPVCIDWQKNYDRLILDEKKKGVVSVEFHFWCCLDLDGVG
jgi:hypothetical protein